MHKHLRSGLLVLSAALSPALTTHSDETATRVVTIDDFGALKHVGEPVLSGDGRRVAYTLEGRIYVVPARGGEPRQVTTGASSAAAPHWSVDGKSLYFLSDRTGASQLWKLPLETTLPSFTITEAGRGSAA
jgi:Tol biopolymer transport system component